MTRYCNIYLIKNDAIFVTENSTNVGINVESEPRKKMPVMASEEELKEVIRFILKSSRSGVPFEGKPVPTTESFAGFKSWGAFAKNCTFICVEEEAGNYTLKRFEKEKTSFSSVSEEPTTLEKVVSVIKALATH